ncbi:Dehydrogenase OXI1 [Colletotrichum shisoi]|uniref:Dehydrogenase OXI1 n=1 Tax=Colletotrichum shisoi TaxID=2078593 RepID=A0A5Q4BB42_9PEZI|nr:Dehydrogenase OXI1 [Colletotrichum shisoi]
MSSHNPSSLRGKVAIVTGGSRGIGAAIAVELAMRGANVTVTYVSETSESLAAEVVERIGNMDNEARATAMRADVSSIEQCKKVVEATIALCGEHVDILVNNAGITSKLSVPDITPADFEQAINTNLRGPLFMAQAVIPHLRRPGRIINITSVAARSGYASASL